MRQVILIALCLLSLSTLSGCTLVDPVYSHQMGGFLMRGDVQTVQDPTVTVKKVLQPVLVES